MEITRNRTIKKLEDPYDLPRHKRDERGVFPKKLPFLYFLFMDGKLVYVGTTDERLPGRIRAHRRGQNTTPKKRFDEVAFIKEDNPKWRFVKEILYIFRYKPKYNAREYGKYWDWK
jgi:hypothetical protein